MKRTKLEEKTYPQLCRDLKKVFNEYIRLRDQDQPCISCGKFNRLQAGHFISVGSSGILRWNEDNVSGQCAGCNMNENLTVKENYERNLRERIGDERVDRLLLIQKKTVKRNRSDLMYMIYHYKQKVKTLINLESIK